MAYSTHFSLQCCTTTTHHQHTCFHSTSINASSQHYHHFTPTPGFTKENGFTPPHSNRSGTHHRGSFCPPSSSYLHQPPTHLRPLNSHRR
ncbi:hypothetical protein Pcinc_015943 [Petrolisthes cinctipes]|uniref:Uncharacterized protein n=1 Tax=Petrolisthes cinctipes TaxID=88211 RepID=A0AAE1FTQ4_PETCI|nr:hypothetical protein Pcinc_015943 [Petrolisthes cinctipes]